jgi:hypothetical protein
MSERRLILALASLVLALSATACTDDRTEQRITDLEKKAASLSNRVYELERANEEQIALQSDVKRLQDCTVLIIGKDFDANMTFDSHIAGADQVHIEPSRLDYIGWAWLGSDCK